MKRSILIILVLLICTQCGYTQEVKKGLLLDDFEGDVLTGQTFDVGSGNGSSVEIYADKELKHSGEQSLKIAYQAVSGGYIYVARGYGLQAKGAAKWLQAPEKIEWANYGAFSFYMYGSGLKERIAFDLKDSGGELFRFIVTDDFKGWKQVMCPFNEFFARVDWQPQDATKNSILDFPAKSFEFEPLAVALGEIRVDEVSLEALN